MGDEEQQNRKLSGEARLKHERYVNDGLSKLSAVKAVSGPTDGDKITEKLKAVHVSVVKTMQPILETSFAKGIVDRQADKEMLASLYLQQLESMFDKDELVFLLTAMIVEETFDKI